MKKWIGPGRQRFQTRMILRVTYLYHLSEWCTTSSLNNIRWIYMFRYLTFWRQCKIPFELTWIEPLRSARIHAWGNRLCIYNIIFWNKSWCIKSEFKVITIIIIVGGSRSIHAPQHIDLQIVSIHEHRWQPGLHHDNVKCNTNPEWTVIWIRNPLYNKCRIGSKTELQPVGHLQVMIW